MHYWLYTFNNGSKFGWKVFFTIEPIDIWEAFKELKCEGIPLGLHKISQKSYKEAKKRYDALQQQPSKA